MPHSSSIPTSAVHPIVNPTPVPAPVSSTPCSMFKPTFQPNNSISAPPSPILNPLQNTHPICTHALKLELFGRTLLRKIKLSERMEESLLITTLYNGYTRRPDSP